MFHMKQTWTWSGSWMWTWKLCLNHMERHSVDSKRSTKRRIALQATWKSRRDTLYAPKILRRVSPIITGKYHTITVFKDSIQEGCFFAHRRHRRLASGLHVAYRRKESLESILFVLRKAYSLFWHSQITDAILYMRSVVFDEKVRSIQEIDTSGSDSPIKYKT